MPLFPVRVVWTDPAGLANGADAAGVCRCDDGCDYALKTNAKNARIPHSEWFCTHLATTVGIAGPPFKVVEQLDGTLAFGSRWEGGVSPDTWPAMIINGSLAFDDVKETLAKIFAFDNFVFNTDRHVGNYIVRSQKTGHAMLALDYSRSWMTNGYPPGALPLGPVNTLTAARWIAGRFGPYITEAGTKETLDRLEAVTEKDALEIINQHPQVWITEPEKTQIVAWWASPARIDRINGIRKGIKDGTYL